MKVALKHVDEIDLWGQFHRHFTKAFFVQKRIEKLFSSYKPKTQLCNINKILHEKRSQKTLMKLTLGVEEGL